MEVRLKYTTENALALANTSHGAVAHHNVRSVKADEPDHDHLVYPGDAADFLRSHDVAVPAGAPDDEALERLRAIREAIRQASLGRNARARAGIARLLRTTAFELTIDYELVPRDSGWRAVAGGLIPAAAEVIDHFERLKHCSNPQCRFLFLDRSGRQNRRWCDMAVCGNRAKALRFRRRHRAGPAGDASRRERAATRSRAKPRLNGPIERNRAGGHTSDHRTRSG